MDRIKIPAAGEDKEELLEEMQRFRENDADWKAGKTWSLVYYAGEEHYEFLKKAHNLFFSENALNPMAFQSLKRFESEVVQMTCSMLHGPENAVGTKTSGGTESILMAVKAYRDRARKKKPWILRPEMVIPSTLHVAFYKAAHYFNIKTKVIPFGDDYRADVKAMKKAIGPNTIMLAASAPQYPHGVVDPIEEIGAIAHAKGIPLHVDGCFGGFMLPWLEKLGLDVPTWDYRVPGVTSISADVHKYGYAAKGASVITYRDMEYMKHQFFVETKWCGGVYASPSMPGTRPGGTIAAAWAALMSMGEDGYMTLAKEALEATKLMRAGVSQIDGLKVLGALNSTVCTWASDSEDVDLYAVADQMAEKGWNTDRQQNPACVHCTVNAHNKSIVPDYLADLEEAVAYVRAHPELKNEGEAAMYGLMAKVPVKGLVQHSVRKVMEGMYSPSGEVPDLSKVGEGDDDMVMSFINKYGDKAMGALEKLDKAKNKLAGVLTGRKW